MQDEDSRKDNGKFIQFQILSNWKSVANITAATTRKVCNPGVTT